MFEFLRGYIEGDGHFHKTNSGRVDLGLCSANRDFLLDFKELCEIALDKVITQMPVLNINPKGQVYSIKFTLDDSAKLINLIYENSTNKTRLDRKYDVAKLVIR